MHGASTNPIPSHSIPSPGQHSHSKAFCTSLKVLSWQTLKKGSAGPTETVPAQGDPVLPAKSCSPWLVLLQHCLHPAAALGPASSAARSSTALYLTWKLGIALIHLTPETGDLSKLAKLGTNPLAAQTWVLAGLFAPGTPAPEAGRSLDPHRNKHTGINTQPETPHA